MTPKRNLNQGKNFVHFMPILMTYIELLPNLLPNGLVAVCPVKPLQPSYLKNYNTNAKCDYHGGTVGHSTKGCLAFKSKVQSLLDDGW